MSEPIKLTAEEAWSEHGAIRSQIDDLPCSCGVNDYVGQLVDTEKGTGKNLEFTCQGCGLGFVLVNVYPKSLGWGEVNDENMKIEEVTLEYKDFTEEKS